MQSGYKPSNQEPALEPSVEAHHRVNGSDTGRNSEGRRIIKTEKKGGIFKIVG